MLQEQHTFYCRELSGGVRQHRKALNSPLSSCSEQVRFYE